ncbi:disease resistance protein RPM1-like [Camellia sinensis]|uniref:disease resistance protein RPM1-like n=1 Tax=Camellia sinensis TaxID=4442 RepID=UPI001036DBEB|nr:disease resistance protein RPM1-like [Camellia sinensis]
MAESAVIHLLANFAPFLQQEANLLTGVRDEIQYIRDEFERMTAFLRVADAMEENDPELKVWVKQVREAAYDIGDVLELFMLRLGHRHGAGFRGFLRKVSCCIKTLIARHQIASDVKGIKTKVKDISERHKRYCDTYRTLEQGSISRPTGFNKEWQDFRGHALLLDESELVGIDKPKSLLINWLVHEDPRLKVFSVSGMGGLGKTTLVKKVFADAVVKNHFQNHAWITVSQSFNTKELLKGMITQLFEEVKQPVPQGVETMDWNSLKGIINAFLRQKRYVLVFDDVWDIQAWQVFRYTFPECNCGSRVMLTTRNADLALFSRREYNGYVYDLQPLSPQESWALFCKKTFQENYCPSHLEGLLTSILRRCEGLPLAIVAISGLLSVKDKSSVAEWEKTYQSLGAELEVNNQLLSMKKILSLSYSDLPHYLKLCFLYLSVFPEDHLIEHWRLIWLWIAEGFVEVKEGAPIEQVAEGYLNELVNRSLIQVAKINGKRRIKLYRIHDLWREIIVFKSREQNIVTIASERDTRWPERVRRLSIHDHLEHLQLSKRFTQLRSLLLFSTTYSPSMPSMLASLRDLKLMKVLDLSGASLKIFPNEVVKLGHLTYLSLKGTEVKKIPKSIGRLKNLEILDLRHTYVTELPDEILNLQRLRHLLAFRYEEKRNYYSFNNECGFKSPVEIGSLTSLQKLGSIEANHGSGSIVPREIGKLTQLKSLGIIKVRGEDGMALCSSLEKLINLYALYVTATEEDEIIDLESLSLPPRLLQTLFLKGRLEKLPHWTPSLHSLVTVCLRWRKLKDADSLQYLQGLPNLVYLDLVEAYEGEELCFKAGGFQKLKILLLIRLKGLRRVTVMEGAMPHLEELYIENCKLMEELPSCIEQLINLTLLDLFDMSHLLLSKLNRDLQGGDYWRISHIPEVWIGDTKDGRWRGTNM